LATTTDISDVSIVAGSRSNLFGDLAIVRPWVVSPVGSPRRRPNTIGVGVGEEVEDGSPVSIPGALMASEHDGGGAKEDIDYGSALLGEICWEEMLKMVASETSKYFALKHVHAALHDSPTCFDIFFNLCQALQYTLPAAYPGCEKVAETVQQITNVSLECLMVTISSQGKGGFEAGEVVYCEAEQTLMDLDGLPLADSQPAGFEIEITTWAS